MTARRRLRAWGYALDALAIVAASTLAALGVVGGEVAASIITMAVAGRMQPPRDESRDDDSTPPPPPSPTLPETPSSKSGRGGLENLARSALGWARPRKDRPHAQAPRPPSPSMSGAAE